MDWSYDLCLRGLLHLLQCMVFSVSAMQHDLDHYKVVNHFDCPVDFNGDVHMQSSLGLQVDVYRASGEP